MLDIIRKSGGNIFLMELYTNEKKQTENLYLDPRGIHGNNCYYINHSCDPNAMFEKWIVEGETRIAVKTIKNINFQESITVNYNITVNNSVSKTVLMKCKCGSDNCKEIVQHYKKKRNNKK
jgi:SET domain-containing protein